ncbi:hypothetical protein [Jannaschia faecimaris]|nr:hypothetical protein [Jannaschia faecimaris]
MTAKFPPHSVGIVVTALTEGEEMRHVQNGYRGLSVFMGLNIDRFLAAFSIGGAILLAAWVQSL